MNKFIKITSIVFLVVVTASCSKTSSSNTQQITEASQSSGEVSFIPANEDDFTVRLADDGTAIITGYIGSGGNVAFPAVIQGVQVTEIGTGFRNPDGEGRISSRNLTGVLLPEGIKVLNDYAFADSGISYIIIPDTVTRIGNGAFQRCRNLEIISIPDSVRSFGGYIFIESGLKSFTIPAGMIAMNEIITNMFEESTLEKIVIPEGIENIRHYVFRNCKNLASVTLPSTIKFIGYEVFDGCSNLTEVIVPESVTKIDFSVYEGRQSSFGGCTKLNLASQARLKQLGYTGNL
jgi:hypothetical protein